MEYGIEGLRCFDCGFALMPQNCLDFYIAPKIVENELLKALKQNRLEKAIETILALDLPAIKIERERYKKMLVDSNIVYSDESSRNRNLMRPCINCGSNNTVAYRWVKKRGAFVPSKNNLRLC